MSPTPSPTPDKQLERFAWGGLLYTVAVVIWGAFVRATGSGAGCGDHWPLCNGELIPREAAVQTLIEFTHRTTSGLAMVFTVVLLVWTRRAKAVGHPMRKAAGWSLFLMMTEALIGAGLVLFKLVATNESMARAYAMSAHLVNTFLLLAALTLTAWFASGGRAFRVRDQGSTGTALYVAAGSLMLVGTSGAVTALGDTLFPAQGFSQGLSAGAHVLLKLRLFHPLLAVVATVATVGAVWMARGTRPSLAQGRYAMAVIGLIAVQMAVGFINVLLAAPVWIQLVHLLLADALWIAFVLAAATALAAAPERAGDQALALEPAAR